VTSIESFVTLVRDELNLAVSDEDVQSSLEDIPGWDSVHLLTLIMLLERETHKQLSIPEVLAADSLARIYELVR
jgi:acyl carrier protein